MIAALGALVIVAASPPAAVDLERGEPAPYAGTLIPVEVALECASCKVSLPVIGAKLDRLQARYDVETKRLETERDAERAGRLRLADALEELAAESEPSVVEHPALWGGIGVVVGIGLTLLVVYAVGGI